MNNIEKIWGPVDIDTTGYDTDEPIAPTPAPQPSSRFDKFSR